MASNPPKDERVVLSFGPDFGLREGFLFAFYGVATLLIGPLALGLLIVVTVIVLATGGPRIRLTSRHVELVGLLWRRKDIARQNIVRVYPMYLRNGTAIAIELYSGKVIHFHLIGIAWSAVGADEICFQLSQEMGLPYTSYGKITQAVHGKLMYLVPLTVLGLVGLCALIFYIAFVYA